VKRKRNPYSRADARTRSARAAGYPARSIYKLREIDRRCSLFARGQRVLDLGAAPGSWALYVSQRVGQEGRVVAVDRAPIDRELGGNVSVVAADALGLELLGLEDSPLRRHLPYDVVLSDMAPRTTGSKISDQTRSFELFMRAVEISLDAGKDGAAFVGKIFMGPDFPQAKEAVQRGYERCRTIKPSGTRPNSSEVYLVGQGKRRGPSAGD